MCSDEQITKITLSSEKEIASTVNPEIFARVLYAKFRENKTLTK